MCTSPMDQWRHTYVHYLYSLTNLIMSSTELSENLYIKYCTFLNAACMYKFTISCKDPFSFISLFQKLVYLIIFMYIAVHCFHHLHRSASKAPVAQTDTQNHKWHKLSHSLPLIHLLFLFLIRIYLYSHLHEMPVNMHTSSRGQIQQSTSPTS